MKAISLTFVGFLAACARPGEENLGLTGRVADHAIDVAQLHQPAELLRALRVPGDELDKRLGARRLEATSTLKIEPPGKPAETLEESFRLDADGRGGVHLVHDNARGYGLEAVVTGDGLYVRPRHGTFVKRRPEGDELARLRHNVEGVAADYLALVEPWLTVREDARTQVAGRPAVRLKLAAKPSASPPREAEPGRKWRQTVKVRFVDGEVLVDAKSGAPLGVRLETQYTFERDGQGPFLATLSYKQSLGAPGPITAPEGAVPAPSRPRPMLDRHQLLEGLK